MLELVQGNWRKAGIKLLAKPLQREVFRRRVYAGQTLVSVWGGLENGLPTAEMSPHELAPVRQDQYQWSRWGQHYESGGTTGDPVDLPAAAELVELYERWSAARAYLHPVKQRPNLDVVCRAHATRIRFAGRRGWRSNGEGPVCGWEGDRRRAVGRRCHRRR